MEQQTDAAVNGWICFVVALEDLTKSRDLGYSRCRQGRSTIEALLQVLDHQRCKQARIPFRPGRGRG